MPSNQRFHTDLQARGSFDNYGNGKQSRLDHVGFGFGLQAGEAGVKQPKTIGNKLCTSPIPIFSRYMTQSTIIVKKVSAKDAHSDPRFWRIQAKNEARQE